MPELTPYTLEEFEASLKFFSFQQIKKVAVACSGGADSLALTFFLSDVCQKHHKKLMAFHVDHRLRKNSQKEAQKVASWLEERNISHKILIWDHEGIESRIQEQARNARYQLLEKACADQGISHLFLAHHRKDQEETFWMRLLKGSGPEGLSGMKSKIRRGNLTLLRPLLNVGPERLRSYLKDLNQSWIEDPSNDNEKYLRIRIRKALLEEGHSFDMLLKTMQKLREDADYFEDRVENWMTQHVSQHESSSISFDCNLIKDLPPALGKRILATCLKRVSDRIYPPDSESLERLWAELYSPSFKATTLASCIIRFKQGQVTVERETRK
ncbi:tRNA lysidine(34) synthetase TilS [Candidatus Bealeia paramacronuclearis]|uniref:tRNA(Ile)-lysidine synthase n=1 Tax=Candidatus Bealeia paramacronuclearis TaxID=1921001 RepID=A0ABZ2C348_9PROT|nr:tRNA lysidine(34) synthetase TilS [Candidatus Bealeia paramacronuclearis]